MRPIKIFMLFLVLVLCGTSYAASYPGVGICRGSNIRLREFPGNKGKVSGQVSTGRHLVVLGETSVDGTKWFKVGHPMRKGNVWLPASYVYNLYQDAEIEPAFAAVRTTFGVIPEKTRVLLGSPQRAGSRYLEYADCKLWYDSGRNLESVEILGGNYSVSDVRVGDDKGKLRKLGMPEDSGESWTWKSKSGEDIVFQLDSGKVSMIIWNRPESEDD